MWHDMFEDKDRSFGDGMADGFLGVPNIHPNDLDYSIGHMLADDTHRSSSSESQVQVSARSSDGGLNIGAIIFGLLLFGGAIMGGLSIAKGETSLTNAIMLSSSQDPITIPAFMGWILFGCGVCGVIGFCYMLARKIFISTRE